MRYQALACDYDGTLAWDGRVDDQTLGALEHLRRSGRKLILVTGRQLDDLLAIFPHAHLFERIVAENGAVLYTPATHDAQVLGERPPAEFLTALRARGVDALSAGRVIVATWQPHETTVLETIRDLGLELHVIFNKGAVMILPSGLNKATGLQAALDDLGLSPHNTVGIGDAENDHTFLSLCECAVAVANALQMLKERADYVTSHAHGAGVRELIGRMVADDLIDLAPRLERHNILLGRCDDGSEVQVSPYGTNLLIAGTSGGGKSTLALGFVERLADKGYQFCIIDPEGDYAELEGAVRLGDSHHAPTVEEVLALVTQPEHNVVVNLLGIALGHRPTFFGELLLRLQALRARTGRPHWILLDETHHLLPAASETVPRLLAQEMYGMIMITVHPEHVSPAILSSIALVIALGQEPEETLRAFSKTIGQRPPLLTPRRLAPGEAIAWWRHQDAAPFWFGSVPPSAERRRHHRKYATGEMEPERHFYFRGPEGKLNLRVQNLQTFLQIAEGIDDATWLYHLRLGDYSRWFHDAINDADLAMEAARIEQRTEVSAQESRALIKTEIEKRYTASA